MTETNQTHTILLLESTADQIWIEAVRLAAARLGRSLLVMTLAESHSIPAGQGFDLVLVEAQASVSMVSHIQDLCARDRNLKVVVFTSGANYEEATEIMRAGAVDYRLKILSEADIQDALKKNLGKQPSCIEY